MSLPFVKVTLIKPKLIGGYGAQKIDAEGNQLFPRHLKNAINLIIIILCNA